MALTILNQDTASCGIYVTGTAGSPNMLKTAKKITKNRWVFDAALSGVGTAPSPGRQSVWLPSAAVAAAQVLLARPKGEPILGHLVFAASLPTTRKLKQKAAQTSVQLDLRSSAHRIL